ncbi:hypothetical protein CFOL_v3_21897 [Cephalotus follicularis]|uniref:Uncharacterized protein n=1 Tax=Cephalotus follicularis TaxID=3775 RepID=A0A1Q3CDX8_CEPFO|nr:hypothetical protein CFOL_v3_21897 [Cephalotus follicularis]
MQMSKPFGHQDSEAKSDNIIRFDKSLQRLLSWEEYAHKLALSKVRWSANLPSHHRRYLSTRNYSLSLIKKHNSLFFKWFLLLIFFIN